jgi:hypothetical protein
MLGVKAIQNGPRESIGKPGDPAYAAGLLVILLLLRGIRVSLVPLVLAKKIPPTLPLPHTGGRAGVGEGFHLSW